DAEQFGGALAHDEIERCHRIRIDIAIDDFVFFLALKHGGEREHRERETAIFRPRGARMEQDDHAAWKGPTRIQNRDGGRLLRSQACKGRRCHCRPYQGFWICQLMFNSSCSSASIAWSKNSMLLSASERKPYWRSNIAWRSMRMSSPWACWA